MTTGLPDPNTAEVVLISMPFGPLQMPSIGLGLLKAALTRKGLNVKDLYFTLDMAEKIGVEAYVRICLGPNSTVDLLGEWLFERELNPDQSAEREQAYLQEILGKDGRSCRDEETDSVTEEEAWVSQLLAWRDQGAFLDECLSEVLRLRPRIVGFTSAFQQNVASLALARRIKNASPETILCLGGSNCEGVMAAELLRQYPFLDAVFSGEGDVLFPKFVEHVLSGAALPGWPGLHHRLPVQPLSVLREGACSTAPAIEDMDALPLPDYTGYFERFHQVVLDRPVTPHILFESSRGCYWGAVSHCTFCGLNGGNMGYRAKTADRALDELVTLVGRYPGAPVTVVDNILSMAYFRDFVPQLAEKQLGLSICYEVKANLTKEQVRLLASAGIRDIQPGIESLSTPLLRLMKKGCTRLQNIQLLKWCRELQVRPMWNILWGFPGEDPAEYDEMAQLFPAISHLHPPMSSARLRLDRFSPLFDDAEGSGITAVAPYASYRHVYGFDDAALRNLAYYFQFQYQDGRDPESYTERCKQAVEEWRAHHETSFFFGLDNGDCLLLVDLRPGATRTFHALAGFDRLLYHACDTVQGVTSLHRMLQASGFDGDSAEIVRRLSRLREMGLMIAEGNQWLALAIAPGTYVLPRQAIRRTVAAARASALQQGESTSSLQIAEVEGPVLSGGLYPSPEIAHEPVGAGVLSGARVRMVRGREVWLDLSAAERMLWQETSLMLAGVNLQ